MIFSLILNSASSTERRLPVPALADEAGVTRGINRLWPHPLKDSSMSSPTTAIRWWDRELPGSVQILMTESWDDIADWYAELLRTGSALHDFSRNSLLARVPENLVGERVLDLGCGEGVVARAAAARGASVVGIDLSPRMIENAWDVERSRPSGASFSVDDGCTLATVGTGSVEWVTAGLSLNNVPDLDAALSAVHRVLVPGGCLVFTIPHPCFEAPHAGWTKTENGTALRVVGDYLTEGFWRSGNPEGVRRAGNQHRKLSTYLTALTRRGFRTEVVEEPAPDADVIAAQPQRAGLPPFMVFQARSG